MKTLRAKIHSGFTVIELMIVIMIVAILVALAYPSYIQYARKAKRGEAQQLLLNWSINQEIFRSNNTSYAADNNANLPKPVHQDGHYLFNAYQTHTDGACTGEADAPNATAYVLYAVAQNDQVNDKARNGDSCATLCFASNGAKLPSNCWD
jgi:type IV pilus assembly protein PilE